MGKRLSPPMRTYGAVPNDRYGGRYSRLGAGSVFRAPHRREEAQGARTEGAGGRAQGGVHKGAAVAREWRPSGSGWGLPPATRDPPAGRSSHARPAAEG